MFPRGSPRRINPVSAPFSVANMETLYLFATDEQRR
jgi:hypothetical protein